MKKKLLLLSFFIGFLVPYSQGQYIPDLYFRQAINSQCDPCIDASGYLVPAFAEAETQLDVINWNIVDISGIEGFTNLQFFYCSRNDITFIPPLPDSLELFYCNENEITSLPPTLPVKLEEFKCDSNQISVLPPLPESLQVLFCSDNNLTALPALPPNLEKLSCNNNDIVQLPLLPASLTSLHCNGNPMQKLPELPPFLEKLYCEQNSLTALPELPDTLNVLDISLNPISCLPKLPYDLQFFDYSNTYIECLPNVIGIFEVSSPLPLCEYDVDSSCTLNPVVTGTVYIDFDGDHSQDIGDIGFPGINVLTSAGNWIGYTDLNGAFKMNTGFGDTFHIDVTPPIGTYDVYPPLGYSLIFDDSTDQSIAGINFSAYPDANTFDLGVMMTPGPATSGTQTNYYLTYKNNGPFQFDGMVQLEFDEDMLYLGASVVPSSQTGNILTWDFLGLGAFKSKTIAITFDIPSTVTAGTQLDVLASGTINGLTDVYPENNSHVDSSTVLGIAVQNYLIVDKTVIKPEDVANGVPLDYTIHFQNKGNIIAEDVELFDTLSANLVATGFELLAASHPNNFELSNDVKNSSHPLILKWTFSNINLPAAANDALGSRGFVKFRAIPSSSLVIGNTITNRAAIQFSNSDGLLATNLVTTLVSNLISAGSPYKEGLELNVFPNPSENAFNVEMKFPVALDFDMKVYNSLGEMVWQTSSFSKDRVTISVDLHQLPSGPYLLKVTGDQVSGAAKIWKL